jgi:hypothetical protein
VLHKVFLGLQVLKVPLVLQLASLVQQVLPVYEAQLGQLV